MKLVDILKAQGLSDDQINQITASMKENKIYETSLENADERYSKMKAKKEDFEEQLKTANTTIEDLKKNNKDNEILQNTIKGHETTIFNYALESALKESKCRNTKPLKALLDMDNIKYQNGKMDGLEEQLNNLKESDSYLFEAGEKPGGSGFNPGGEPPKGKGDSATCFVDVIKNNQLRK